MHEAIYNAKAELKRADHLIFVSLKYTRTVDVIRSIIERLIAAYDNAFESLLRHAKDAKLIPEVPQLPRLKIDALLRLYPTDEPLKNFIEFYQLLRKISKAQFTRSQEYRRHVAMIAEIDEEKVEITIDIINDYYEKTKEFISLVDAKINNISVNP